MDPRISEFNAEDYDDAYALWKRTPGMGISEADSRERITSFLARNPGLCFVAREEGSGRLVGTILCGSDTRRGYLYHLAVDESCRRQGLGSRLADSAEAALRSQGVEKCHLMVIAGNELGTAFWKGRGYKLRTDIDLYSKGLGD
jgi:ribosomal protein S18 acetylase RimI-like enzyme